MHALASAFCTGTWKVTKPKASTKSTANAGILAIKVFLMVGFSFYLPLTGSKFYKHPQQKIKFKLISLQGELDYRKIIYNPSFYQFSSQCADVSNTSVSELDTGKARRLKVKHTTEFCHCIFDFSIKYFGNIPNLLKSVQQIYVCNYHANWRNLYR